jgi:tripartite-type tricarboxylate transporter receptor subunit TctC
MNKRIAPMCMLILLCLTLCSIVSFGSSAQFPIRPIELIVPFSPGGQTDIIARTIAEYVIIEQPLVVTNMPGASTSIAVMEVYNSEPDGYRLLVVGKESQMFNYLTGSIPVPTWKEFIPVCSITYDSHMIAVSKDSPFNSIEDIVDYAKKNPGKLTWGSAGAGSTNHLNSEFVFKVFDVDITYVPYPGNADARVAVMGGHLDVFFGSVSEIKSYVEGGELKPILIISTKRDVFLPDVPVLGEFTDEPIRIGVSTGLWAPPKTPKEVIEKLESAFEVLSKDKDFVSLVRDKLSYDVRWLDSSTVQSMMKEEYPFYEEMSGLILEKIK